MSSAAARQREHRRRQRAGVRILRVEVRYHELILAMLLAGADESEMLDPRRVEARAGEWLAQAVEGWLRRGRQEGKI